MAVVAAVRAIKATNGFLDGLNLSSPVLTLAKEGTLQQLCPKLSERVILIVVDGLRVDESFRMKTLNSLRQNGTEVIASSHYPSISRPNYVSLAASVPPKVSGLRMNFSWNRLSVDTIMRVLRDSKMTSAYVGNESPGLPELFGSHLERGLGFNTAHFSTWQDGFRDSSLHVLEEDHAFIFLLTGDVDVAGHEFGGASEEYQRAAQKVDGILFEILQSIDLQSTTVIVTADHGHTDSGGHGGVEDNVMSVPLILAGAGVTSGAPISNASILDVAPTTACLLGTSVPRHSFGKTLTQAITLPLPTVEKVRKQDLRRIKNLQNNHQVALTVADAKTSATRRQRLVLCAIFLLLFLFLSYLAFRNGIVAVDGKIFMWGLLAFPISYYGLLGLFGQQYTLSVIPSTGDLTTILLKFGSASTAVFVVVTWLLIRDRKTLVSRLAAVNGVILAGLFLAYVPAMALWVMFPEPHYRVPSPLMIFMIPSTYAAVFCFASASALTLLLETTIFISRATAQKAIAQGR